MEESQGAMGDAARLRAESDAFQAHLARLSELEGRKRELPPSDPGFVALAVEIEELAAAVLKDARGQTDIGQLAHIDGVNTPIVDVPDDLTTVQILAQWRAAERELATKDPSSDDARDLRTSIDGYRRAYQAAFERTKDR